MSSLEMKLRTFKQFVTSIWRKEPEVEEKIFNRRLCPARRYSDCTFWTFSRRWRIFHRALSVKLTAPRIIYKYTYCYIILCVKEMVTDLTTWKVDTRYLQVQCNVAVNMRVALVHIVQVMFRVVSARLG